MKQDLCPCVLFFWFPFHFPNTTTHLRSWSRCPVSHWDMGEKVQFTVEALRAQRIRVGSMLNLACAHPFFFANIPWCMRCLGLLYLPEGRSAAAAAKPGRALICLYIFYECYFMFTVSFLGVSKNKRIPKNCFCSFGSPQTHLKRIP